MDAAAAAEPTDYTTHQLTTLGERVSAIEGTIRNYDRIFDMLHEGQKNLRIDIGKDIANTNQRIEDLRGDIDWRFGEMREDMDKRFGDIDKRFGEMREDMDKRFGDIDKRFGEMREDMDKRFGEMNERITRLGTRIDMANTKMDSTFKWLLGVQIAMWVTIIAAVLL